MNEPRRNLMVGIFVALGVAAVGWLILRFGELPDLIQKLDSYEIDIHYPDASGVRENTQIQFRGYPVGRIIEVHPPKIMTDPRDGEVFIVVARASIEEHHQIPRNVIAETFQRGFGSAYIQLNLQDQPSSEFLQPGDAIPGRSGGTSVLPESTQKMLENVASSLASLADDLRSQFQPLPPEDVDADPNETLPNITTAIIRLDSILKNVNEVVADEETKQNVRRLLAEAVATAEKAQQTLDRIDTLASNATELAQRSHTAIENVESYAAQLQQDLSNTAIELQQGLDAFAAAMGALQEVMARTRQGEGTAGRLVRDPKLYEEMVDTLDILQATMMEFQKQIQLWREHGILYKE